MNQQAESLQARPPRVALAIATGFGLGSMPKAPGTWGSLGGLALCWLVWKLSSYQTSSATRIGHEVIPGPELLAFLYGCFVALALAVLGVWVAGRAAKHFGVTDPQRVVIDEISGQQLTLLAGLAWSRAPNWKYLLLGFILFRVLDIWKPFPARQAESLPGGWGIMTDDWVAGIYAALGLWLARALGF